MTWRGKLRAYYYNTSIMIRLMAGFLSASLFLILLIGLIANAIFSSAIEKSAKETTIQAIKQANLTVDNYLQNAANIMGVISGNRQVLGILKSTEDSIGETASSLRITTGNYLASLVDGIPYFKGIALVRNDDTLISNEMYFTNLTPVKSEDWYIRCAANPMTVQINPRPDFRNLSYYKPISADSIISLSMAIPDPATGAILGAVVIDLDSSILDETLMNTKVGKNGFIFLVDQIGTVIYTPVNPVVYRIRPEWLSESPSNIFNKRIGSEIYQLIYSSSDYTGWKIVGVFSLTETLQQVANFRYILGITLIVAMFLVVLFSVLFARGLTKPIRKLKALMKQAESGNLSVQFETRYNDEIGQLGNSFNTMIKEIRNLVDQIYLQQQQKRSAELTTLQSQIKPHFLYNTFDTIHWMAKRHGAKDIEQIISALTKLYRIGLSKGNEVITVGEEIEHVRNYLIIQNIRYKDILEYEVVCEERAAKMHVQKLILQPIVENAIYHGIKNKIEPGMITVRAYIDADRLVFEIKDDGPGMTPEKVENLNTQIHLDENRNLGYGLYNVNKRIVLMHGKEFGVAISSAEGSGTTVTIIYPMINSKEGQH